jgi:hypothetical protein
MGLSIKHAETEAKVRELARRRRQSMTKVVHDAVDEALRTELRPEDDPEVQERVRRALAFVDEMERLNAGRAFPSDKDMDAWLYDEDGLPAG